MQRASRVPVSCRTGPKVGLTQSPAALLALSPTTAILPRPGDGGSTPCSAGETEDQRSRGTCPRDTQLAVAVPLTLCPAPSWSPFLLPFAHSHLLLGVPAQHTTGSCLTIVPCSSSLCLTSGNDKLSASLTEAGHQRPGLSFPLPHSVSIFNTHGDPGSFS